MDSSAISAKVCLVSLRVLAGVWLICCLSWGQQTTAGWQEQVRNCAQKQDWSGALRIVDHEIALAPQDMDVRAWRARVLLWSGRLADAEHEYSEILKIEPRDPDNWMGLASVYSREQRWEAAVKALDHALQLDPKRADIHVARGRALREMHDFGEAKVEFQRALDIEPESGEARSGLVSLRREPKHEFRLGVDTDLFSFADANQDGGISLTSQWTSRWRTSVFASSYQRAGINAEKFGASVGARSVKWGTLSMGGAAAHDHTVIPKSEAFFDYDRGWKIGRNALVRGLEIDYGQHWYWYSSARILTVNEANTLYFPGDWTLYFGLIGARSHFSGAGTEWRPSGITRLNFPITGNDERRLGGNLFYAVGTENFAQVDQIGSFSSHTYGGGLRFQMTPRQDVTGFAGYQQRTQNRTQISFGFTYGIRF
jgi:tetratricopeptide (TPR) repeat protein